MFFDFNGFWRENDVTRLTAKFKFEDMAQQINNVKKHNVIEYIECENFFFKDSGKKGKRISVIRLFKNSAWYCRIHSFSSSNYIKNINKIE